MTPPLLPTEPARMLLVVDDERELAEALELSLSSLPGYRVQLCHDGHAALAHLPLAFALLTDLDLPRLSGEELITKFRALHPRATIVVFSATHRDSLPQIMALGASVFFPKPFSVNAIKMYIKEQCQHA